MKRKIVPLLLAGVLTLGAVPARAVGLPMFKQEATVTISREEYESLQKYRKTTIMRTRTRTRCSKTQRSG